MFPGLQYTLLCIHLSCDFIICCRAFLPYYRCFSHYFPVLMCPVSPVLILIWIIQCCVLPL
ncbi:uncharacterized protein B0H18DRAFT_1050598 [Fomitopsis serialis]|uniref:uncharacterized protein n=1 Tax=Fomitopsis serialis TaxID=139415 RepID=UPI002008661A|nr:uncharacterized protein B0H18DRAFT_1050598 [Neoantrodia serialis]KAH9913118.1 hypothetical protein B0H18DRAFT_1050598 [Neoantrodia serialis]